MLDTANLYEVTLDAETLAEARDILGRGYNLRSMIVDHAVLGLSHAEKGNTERAEEYAAQIAALQDLEYREYWASPGYQTDGLLPSERATPHPQRLTLLAYFSGLFHAYQINRTPKSWITYRPGEIEPNPDYAA